MNRMKAFLILACLCGSMLVHGQFVKSFGLKTGISLANQSYQFTPIDAKLPTDVLPGPGVVFFMEALKGEHLSFQLDIGYLRKGNRTTAESVTINHLENNAIVINTGPLTTSKFHYLTISPMARYRYELSQWDLYVLLGPRMDYLISYNTDSEYPIEQQKEILFGLSSGIGAEYKFEKVHVFAEIQYQYDLSPLTNVEPLLVKNNCLFLTLGLRK